MRKINYIALCASIVVFMLMSIVYEYYVDVWSQSDGTVVIRVDIFIVYPLFILIGLACYFLINRFFQKK